MLNKKTLLSFSVFALLVLSLVAVSALTSTIISKPTSVNENIPSYTFTLNITNNGASTINVTFASSTSFGSVSVPSISNLAAGVSTSVTGTVSGFANQGGNTQNILVNASAINTTSSSVSFSVAINDILQLCPNGTVGDLKISDFSINNLGEGDEEEWMPLDEIEIEVEVENTNNDDPVSDVQVDLYIFDENNNDVTDDFDLDDDTIDLGKIKEDEQETATFRIPEIPADMDEGKYRLYLQIYSDGDEDTQCVDKSDDLNEDTYHEVDYTREEDKAVVVRQTDLSTPITASCGEGNLIVTIPIYNIGTDKEESVLVNLYNKELGIDAYDVVEDLKSGKRTEMSFEVSIPQNARGDKYKLDVFTFFDYDEDGDKMEESSYDTNSFEDLDENFQLQLEVLGCLVRSPSISAKLDSGAALGQELVIKSFITNNLRETETFLVTVSGLEGWATLVSVSPQSLTLGENEGQEVIIRLNPTSEGFHSFVIDTSVGGETYSQPVSVNVAGKSKTAILGSLDQKTLTYIVIGLVVLIILLIILIVVKASRSSSSKF